MTKSVIISFDEADENLIKMLFKKMKIKVKPLSSLDEVYKEATKAEILQSIRDGLEEVKAHRLGKIKLPSAAEFLEELRDEEALSETKKVMV